MVRQLLATTFYRVRDPKNFYKAMRRDVALLLEHRAYLSLTTVIVCCLDALAAGSGKASRRQFEAFVVQHFPELCADLHARYPTRPGARSLYDGFRNGFTHLRGPKSEFAIAEDHELDGAWADTVAVDGVGQFVALNVDRLAREFLNLLDELEQGAKTRPSPAQAPGGTARDRPTPRRPTRQRDSKEAYVGIDVAFAKQQRLPVVVCTRQGRRLVPLPLREMESRPPRGQGNAKSIEPTTVRAFAEETTHYLHAVEAAYRVRIQLVAVDASREPKRNDSPRRECERGLDERRISCITTPSGEDFEHIRNRVRAHLAAGKSEATLPAANQLWMLVGFALFERLSREWECLEVFPQAIAVALNAHADHKRSQAGRRAQLAAAARHTGWPPSGDLSGLAQVGFGSQHDRLDAYLAAWVASLDERDREAIGRPPRDVIWVPSV